MSDLTAARASHLFTYDEVTGELRRRIDWYGYKAGSLAGRKRERYMIVSADGSEYRAHRVMWLMKMGRWPREIDHINGDGFDNRWENLREVDRSGNLRNCARRSDNTSGVVGVSFVKRREKYRAYIKTKNGVKNLYWGDSFVDACRERQEAEIRYGYHENHGR